MAIRMSGLTLSNPLPADFLLSRQRFIDMSGTSLQQLGCHLTDISLLQNFPNLKKLALLSPEHIDSNFDDPYSYGLSVEQAQHLSSLRALTHLSFSGFISLPLHQFDLPALKVRMFLPPLLACRTAMVAVQQHPCAIAQHLCAIVQHPCATS